MKKMTSFAALVAVSTFSVAALAGEWTTAWDTIDALESFGDDLHVFGLNLSPNPAGCSVTNVAKVQYSLSTIEKERLGLILTSAFLAGRQVKVKLQSNYCESGGVPAIYGVDVL
jgi:hypothetical protein